MSYTIRGFDRLGNEVCSQIFSSETPYLAFMHAKIIWEAFEKLGAEYAEFRSSQGEALGLFPDFAEPPISMWPENKLSELNQLVMLYSESGNKVPV